MRYATVTTTQRSSEVFFLYWNFILDDSDQICDLQKNIFFARMWMQQQREKICPAVARFFICLVLFFGERETRNKRTNCQINWKCNALGNDKTKWNLITPIRWISFDFRAVGSDEDYLLNVKLKNMIIIVLSHEIVYTNERAKSQFPEFIRIISLGVVYPLLMMCWYFQWKMSIRRTDSFRIFRRWTKSVHRMNSKRRRQATVIQI